MFAALGQALMEFLYSPAAYMLAQTWLVLLTLWWTAQAWRARQRFRFWFVPAVGLVLTQAVALVSAWVIMNQPARYAPWWWLRALQAAGAYFLLWAWSLPLNGRQEAEWYRGSLALLALVGLPASLTLHALGSSRWASLEMGWLVLGALTGLGGIALALRSRPFLAAEWFIAGALLFALGFVADLAALGHWRGAARLAELAAYPLLLWWPVVFSPEREALARWRERLRSQQAQLESLHQRVRELEDEAAQLQAQLTAQPRVTGPAWCDRGGYLIWQAFGATLKALRQTLHAFGASSVWPNLSPPQRVALGRLEALAQFHDRALSAAVRRDTTADEWAPWTHIWNRVLQELGTFAQTADQTLVLALPNEIFTWNAPLEATTQALYFVLARALWVSPGRSEIVVQGQVVQMEPGGLGVLLEVTDQGPPLTDETLIHIFFATDDPNAQTLAADDMGVNLGLRLARRQMLAVQGALWVTQLGEQAGSAVAVLVPTRQPEGDPTPTPAAEEASHVESTATQA